MEVSLPRAQYRSPPPPLWLCHFGGGPGPKREAPLKLEGLATAANKQEERVRVFMYKRKMQHSMPFLVSYIYLIYLPIILHITQGS